MKRFMYYIPFLLVLIFFDTKNINAQIPNGDFESWTNGSPDSWFGINIAQSTDKYSGNYAIKGTVDSSFGTLLSAQLFTSFDISKTYASLTGFYKFTPLNPSDVLYIVAEEFNDTSLIPPGAGALLIGGQNTSYKQFTVPITFLGDVSKITSMTIAVDIEDTADNYSHDPATGSFFIIDDFQLSEAATGISDQVSFSPNEFKLNQNYPNPFNPSTTIQYSIPKESFVSIKVFDVLGNEITTLTNERKAEGNYSINFNGGSLPSGVYIYRMQPYLKVGKQEASYQRRNLFC